LSNHGAADASTGVQRNILTAHDEPEETPEEITRRTFMANATLTIGGIIGVVLAIPIVGSLIPQDSGSKGSWSPLTADELTSLQSATSKPVKMTFTLKYTDGYLPEQAAEEYVWGIKIDESKFKAARPDIYDTPGGNVDYPAVNMGFVIFSPICPHLGCRFNWSDAGNKFMCPCHGSQYNFDGTHIPGAGPAPRGLDPLPLREQTGTAQVTWIQYKANVPDRVVISYQA
jgi:menaquinol-cytochrome c reductase iron-sulfur subunit